MPQLIRAMALLRVLFLFWSVTINAYQFFLISKFLTKILKKAHFLLKYFTEIIKLKSTYFFMLRYVI